MTGRVLEIDPNTRLVEVDPADRNYPPLVAVDVRDFLAREIPQREFILEPWMPTQSLSMIYSWRGVGKTHVALGIAYAVATGGEFLKWKAPKPRKVLTSMARCQLLHFKSGWPGSLRPPRPKSSPAF